MNDINKVNSNNQINFKGIQKMAKSEKTFEEKIENMIKVLRNRAEREVPEYGDFALVYEEMPNTEKSLASTDFMLKITKPPKTVSGHEKIRNLEAIAYDLPNPYKCEFSVASGSKADILKALEDENLPEKLKEIFVKLSKDLKDI